MSRLPGFVNGSYTLPSLDADCQNCVNLYAEINEQKTAGSGEVGFLQSVPGLRLVCTINSLHGRGLWTAANGTLYAASGTELCSISSTYSKTTLGTLKTSRGSVSMADNTTQLCLVDGNNGYVLPLAGGTLAEIPKESLSTGDGFKGADRVSFLDNYIIFNEPGTGRIYYSALGDASNISGLDYTTAEGSPDIVVGHIVSNREVWVGGTDSMEVLVDSGGSDNVLVRQEGVFIEFGLASPFSLQKLANTVLWLGGGANGAGIVWQAIGYQPKRISTHAIERVLAKYQDLSGAVAWTYQDRGHQFYCLNIPGEPETWCYDLTTGLWHERVDFVNGEYEQFRVGYHAFAYGKHFVLGSNDGNLYEMDPDWPLFGTDKIYWERTGPHSVDGLKNNSFSSFQMDMEVGNPIQGYSPATLQGSNAYPAILSTMKERLAQYILLRSMFPLIQKTSITVNGVLIEESDASESSPFAGATSFEEIAEIATVWCNLAPSAIITYVDDPGYFLVSTTPTLSMPTLTNFNIPVIAECESVVSILGFASVTTLHSPGVPGIPNPSQDPQICMQYSDDAGHTWSTERWKSCGKTGEHSRRVKWNRCGSGRRRVFRVFGSDPVRISLFGAEVEIMRGTS